MLASLVKVDLVALEHSENNFIRIGPREVVIEEGKTHAESLFASLSSSDSHQPPATAIYVVPSIQSNQIAGKEHAVSTDATPATCEVN